MDAAVNAGAAALANAMDLAVPADVAAALNATCDACGNAYDVSRTDLAVQVAVAAVAEA